MGKQTPNWNLHLRFNPQNPHHQRAVQYLDTIRGKYKAAFIAAVLEEYQERHPYGPDYQELERIRLMSHRSFWPKKPILENIRERMAVHREKPKAESPPVLETRHLENSMDQVIDLYQLDDE